MQARQTRIGLGKFILASTTLILLLSNSAALATWYGEGIDNGADIVMMDLRWPWWPSGTYYANWNTGINPQGGISFYAGFLGGVPDGPGCTPNPDEKLQDAYRPGSVWSFWGGDRLSGVAMARSDENVVVVRSTSNGLMRTTDGGKTWSGVNGNLTGAANAVRSVAIYPANPAIMLRAAGRVVNGKCEGGLWKTTDGGKTWSKLDFQGDFDGIGPSALCGEVIAFDLKDPQTLYVGTESRGCFKSTDGGATWTSLGVAGQRITSVVVWPWDYVNPVAGRGMSHLCVTTCPDKWMPLLGRGMPAITTGGETAKSYVSHDNIKSLSVCHSRADLGFYNMAFDRMCQNPGQMSYATSYGLQHNVGGDMFAFPEAKHLEWMRPFTAVYSACLPGTKNARCIAQALDPVNSGRISVSQSWAFSWNWINIRGSVPKGGLVAVTGEYRVGEKWWFLYTDGLYYSPDGGKNMTKVLDASGKDVDNEGGVASLTPPDRNGPS